MIRCILTKYQPGKVKPKWTKISPNFEIPETTLVWHVYEKKYQIPSPKFVISLPLSEKFDFKIQNQTARTNFVPTNLTNLPSKKPQISLSRTYHVPWQVPDFGPVDGPLEAPVEDPVVIEFL